MSHTDALQITPTGGGPALSPAQKRFNTLTRRIEQARLLLLAWQEQVPAFRRSHAEVLQPLQAQLVAGHRAWMLALEAALGRPGWRKAERELLAELLCEAAEAYLEAHGDDPQIKALFDRHAEVDFDTEQRERMRAMKGMAESMTGLDLGEDDGIDTEAALFERLQEGLRAQAAAEEAERSARASRRRKSAAQQRREAEAQQATQSLREIYRKLASALHPDRETDERQRDHKTALMQRANQAYEARDLLALLQLQLQIEQIDAGHIAGAGEQRLKHYNKVLAEQLAELEAEIERVEFGFCMEFGLQPGRRLDPRRLQPILEQTRRLWQGDLDAQRLELQLFDDDAATRRWLKRQRQQRRDAAFDFTPF